MGRRSKHYRIRSLCDPPILPREVATEILLPHYIDALRMDPTLLEKLRSEAEMTDRPPAAPESDQTATDGPPTRSPSA